MKPQYFHCNDEFSIGVIHRRTPEMQTEPTVCDTYFMIAFESLCFHLSPQENEALQMIVNCCT